MATLLLSNERHGVAKPEVIGLISIPTHSTGIEMEVIVGIGIMAWTLGPAAAFSFASPREWI